jgi:hypothetical protein
VTATDEVNTGEPTDSRTRAATRVLAAVAGPIGIVAAVVVALHPVLLGEVPIQNLDLLAYFFPNHCYLGSSLAAGRIPAWNPYAMGGVPFAADPQSGWMYLPAMLLYGVLPCDLAVRAFIVSQPLLAGLGAFWFLRGERLSRPAATAGGLALSLTMANSAIVASLPFAGALAWSMIVLGAASRCLRSTTWHRRLAFAALTGAAWSQLAAAHMSHGLVLGTSALAVYAGITVWRGIRGGTMRRREAFGTLGLLALALPTVSLAFLLPRLAYLPRTSLALGYRRLNDLAAVLGGRAPTAYGVSHAAKAGWIAGLAGPSGAYLGSAGLLLSFGGLWSRRHRPLSVAFLGFAAVAYLLGLRVVAERLAAVVGPLPRGDFYLHAPSRFSYGVILAAAILLPLGMEAWREAGSPHRVAIMGVALLVWGILLSAGGGPIGAMVLPLVGAVATVIALILSGSRPVLLALVPLVLAVELLIAPLMASSPESQGGEGRFGRLLPRSISPDNLVTSRSLLATVRSGSGRLLTVTRREVQQRMQATLHSILFQVEEAQGYNPIQPVRYWQHMQASNPQILLHNSAIFTDPSPQVLDLLQVEWVLSTEGRGPGPGWVPVGREDGWTLYRLRDPLPRASVLDEWEVVESESEALRRVTSSLFDPSRQGVLEEPVPIGPGPSSEGGEPAPPPSARYRPLGPQAARVDVSVPAPGLLVVRNAYDPNWSASLDGRPVELLRVDFFLQGVVVPPGRHVLLLRYDDPWVGYGLLGSSLSLAALLGAAAALRARSGRAAPPMGASKIGPRSQR